MILAEFFEAYERESWTGTATAFRSGAKYRVAGLDPAKSGYTTSVAFQEAWRRGWNEMDQFLSAGGRIDDSAIIVTVGGSTHAVALSTGAADVL